MYFGPGQYIGDFCDGREVNILGSVACEHNGKNAAILHAEAGASVMPRDVHSGDVDRRPLGTRQSCLQKEAVCGEAADNPCRVRDVSWSSDDIENTPRGRCASGSR